MRVQELERRVEGLLRALEEAQRAGKRQAAPFSRHRPKADPAKPGRKAGARYGCRSRRAIPATIDQTLEAELPGCCPRCGGDMGETGIEKQYQTEIPQPQVERIEFRIHVGRCKRCGQRVRGRHPRQTSDAAGSAASQLGARAVALATELNKGLGIGSVAWQDRGGAGDGLRVAGKPGWFGASLPARGQEGGARL